MPRPNKLQSGRADVRLAVVSPFVDRRHGTERALAELLERLARDHHCEVHLYAQRVADLAVSPPQRLPAHGSIVWHRIPAVCCHVTLRGTTPPCRLRVWTQTLSAQWLARAAVPALVIVGGSSKAKSCFFSSATTGATRA